MFRYDRYRNVLLLTLLAAVCFLTASCAVVTWEYPDIVCGIDEDAEWYSGDIITVWFSIKPDMAQVETCIQLQCEGKNVETDISWNDDTAFIKPLLKWEKGKSYRFSVAGSLRMADGRVYSEKIYRSFNYGAGGNELVLTDRPPPGLVQMSETDPLSFVFSRQVDVLSFIEQFSLSPYCETETVFSPGNMEVSVIPAEGWKANTLYKWSLGSVSARDGYSINRNAEGSFYSVVDTEVPELLTVCPVDYDAVHSVWFEDKPIDGVITERQSVGFIFSKPMKPETVISAVSVSPSVKGRVLQADPDCTRFVFVPDENYKLKQKYQLTVSVSASDTAGLPLYTETRRFFTTVNDYLKTESVSLDAVVITVFDDENVIHTLKKDTDGEYYMTTSITFSTEIDRTLQQRAVGSISVRPLFPSTAKSPTMQSASWSPDEKSVSIQWKGFTAGTGDISNYYKLTITGGTSGAQNSVGDYLEKDVCVVFKTVF